MNEKEMKENKTETMEAVWAKENLRCSANAANSALDSIYYSMAMLLRDAQKADALLDTDFENDADDVMDTFDKLSRCITSLLDTVKI